MDNPIYEPKNKEVTGDGEDPAAGPVEVDGPASNTYVTFFISILFPVYFIDFVISWLRQILRTIHYIGHEF